MRKIDYKEVFSKLSHIKALSSDKKIDEIIQNLILFGIYNSDNIIKTESDIRDCVENFYGINIRLILLQSNLDKLISLGKVLKNSSSKELSINSDIRKEIENNIKSNLLIEEEVRKKWFEVISSNYKLEEDSLLQAWHILTEYFSKSFEKNGIQTVNFLTSTLKKESDFNNNLSILESIFTENEILIPRDIFINCLNSFIQNADKIIAKYISQLADAAFTSYALMTDEQTKNFLNSKFTDMRLFLDTNFIFGILDLHKNNEDSSAKGIIEEIKRKNLPFKLVFHPETLNEFKRTIESKSYLIRNTKWTKEISRIAVTEIEKLSPLEELYHKQNMNEEIDPNIFLEKYEHIDIILKEMGLIEYFPKYISEQEEYDIETDIESYKNFLENNNKVKPSLSLKHDIIVLREVRSLNSKKTKFLDAKAFFLSSDYVLGKFEKQHYKKDWEINMLVNPSVFLQLIRPFIENDYSSNKRFIDTFSIQDFRSFDIDYSTTRSKTLQILNDNYYDTSYETKVKILRDQVLLEKLQKAENDEKKKNNIIESFIAQENSILSQKLEDTKHEKDSIIAKKIKAEVVIKDFKTQNQEKDQVINKLTEKLSDMEIELEKEKKRRIYKEWEDSKTNFIRQRTKVLRNQYYNDSKFFSGIVVLLFFGIIMHPIYIKYFNEIFIYLEKHHWIVFNSYIIPIGVLVILFLITFGISLYRMFFLNDEDKKRMKKGFNWVKTLGRETKKMKLLKKEEENVLNEFLLKYPEPEKVL